MFAGRDLTTALGILVLLVFLVGAACGGCTVYGITKASHYRVRVERVR